MDENTYLKTPIVLELIEAETKAIGFSMSSERLTGAFLRALAASKPRANILELGTGTGISAAWLLDGMDEESHLTTVDNDVACVEVAKRHLGMDRRVTFHIEEGLELALAVLKVGGFYVIDDLLPQPSWPDDHAPKVPKLVESLAQCRDLVICAMSWGSGLLIAVKQRAD
jgi:O-methyltransferase